MFYLIDRKNGKIIEKHDKDYGEFLKNKWEGWHPFVLDGKIHCSFGLIKGCEDYSKLWVPHCCYCCLHEERYHV